MPSASTVAPGNRDFSFPGSARKLLVARPQTRSCRGAASRPPADGEKKNRVSGVRLASGWRCRTRTYGSASRRVPAARAASPPTVASVTPREPSGRPFRSQAAVAAAIMRPRRYTNGRPRFQLRLICQSATNQPAKMMIGLPRRYPRTSRNSESGIPPLDSTWRWLWCARRNGAYANAAPATPAPRGSSADLARQEISADEGENVGEEKEQVVANCGGLQAVADEPCQRIAGEGVAESKARAERPEDVCVEEVERLVQERMAAPGHRPRLEQRILHVLGITRNPRPDVRGERPGHRDRQRDRDEHDPCKLPRKLVCGRGDSRERPPTTGVQEWLLRR